MSFKMFVFLVLVILMGFFVIQNTQIVEIEFLIWKGQASRVLIYLSIFVIGSVTGWLGSSLRRL